MGEPINTELRAEYDALVDLGQTGVHVVKRSQAFKDTGWDPTEACLTGGVVDGRLYEMPHEGDWLHDEIRAQGIEKGSPELELSFLRRHVVALEESEDPLLYSIQVLTSSDGRECGLLTQFYDAVWNRWGDADSCRWIVFPSLEDLDLFLLVEDKLRMPYEHRDNTALLLKWNKDNREFWDSVYQFHETPKDCDK